MSLTRIDLSRPYVSCVIQTERSLPHDVWPLVQTLAVEVELFSQRLEILLKSPAPATPIKKGRSA